MVVQLLAVAAAVISVAGISYATSRYLRVRHDFYLRNAWRATMLLSIGLILSVHVVSATLDHVLGVVNLARFFENSLIALSGYFADAVHVAMVHGTTHIWRRHRWVLGFCITTILAMAFCLWRADVPELESFARPQVNLWLVLYRLAWLGFLSFVIVRLIIYNRRFGRLTPDPIINLTTWAMVFAGYFAIGVIVTTMAEPLVPQASALLPPLRVLLELCVIGMAACFMSSTLPTWNPRLGGPAVARLVVSATAYRVLGELWRTITAATPEVVLPTSARWIGVLVHPATMDLLLHRRVIEILDGLRLLLSTDGAQRNVSLRDATEEVSEGGHVGGDVDPATGPREDVAPIAIVAPRLSETRATLGVRIVEDAHASGAQLARMQRAAEVDADRLIAALSFYSSHDPASGRSEVQQSLPAYAHLLTFQPQTYPDAVRYLEALARAFHARRSHREAIRTPDVSAGSVHTGAVGRA